MSQATPVISVQLNAKGVADVTAAFAQVRQQGVSAAQDTAKGFDVVSDGLKSIQLLLPEIAVAALIEQVGAALVDAGKQAIDYTLQLGKLSEKTGVAVGTLSALALAAREAGVDQDALSAGLVKLTRSAEQAGAGAAAPKKAFADLGITLNDLKTKDPGQIFAMVATGLEKIENPGTRANDIVALFGKSGSELIPVLQKVADEGLQGLVDKAQRLGVYLSGDFVQTARKAEGELADLKAAGEGVALQFLSGALPAVEKLAGRLASFVGSGATFKTWGQTVGNALLDAAEQIEVFIGPLSHLSAQVKTILADFKLIGDVKQVALPTGKNANKSLAERLSDVKDDFEARQDDAEVVNDYDPDRNARSVHRRYQKMRADLAKEANTPPPADTSAGTINANATGISKDAAAKAEAQAKRDDAAQIALEQSEANDELSILKAKNAAKEQYDQEAYQNGLITLEQYYDNRAARINASTDAEEAILAGKRAIAQAMPQTTGEDRAKRLQAIDQIQTQMDLAELARQSQLAQNDAARDKARHDAALQQLQDQKKIQEAEGDKSGAAATGLQIDLQQYDESLKKTGVPDDVRASKVQDAKKKGEAKIDFSDQEQDGSDAMASMNQAISDVQDKASAGQITQLDAATQILKIEQDRLPILQQIGAEMTQDANDSGDDALKAKADAYNASLKKVEEQTKQTYNATVDLYNQIETQGVQATESFFTSWLSGSKSFGDSIKDLGDAFAQMVAGMVGKLLVLYAIEKLVGWITGGDDNAVASAAKLVTGHQSGGFTADVAEDQIAGVVHGREYVVDAANTRKYRPMWEAMEAGLDPVAALPVASMAAGMSPMPFRSQPMGSAAGVSQAAADATSAQNSGAAAGNSAPPEVHVINNTGQPAKTTQSKGSNGQSITSVIIGAVSADIAKGGQSAKAIQSTYGVNRVGVNRGSS